MIGRAPIGRYAARRKIEFADTDMGGIVHFARFFVFLETAEHEFLESLGMPVIHRREGHQIGWPRVSASLEYLSPARLGDELVIALRVARKGRTSLTYEFDVSVGERRVAVGRMTSVCCIMDDPAGVRPVPIPPEIGDRIGERR